MLFCAVVGADEASTIPKNRKEQQFFDVTSGLSALIGQMIASVQGSLHELTVQTENLIQTAIAEIDSTISSTVEAFGVYIQEVKDQIEKLINEELLPCLDRLLGEIDDAVKEVDAKIRNCRENAIENLSYIQKDVETYKKENQAAFEGTLAFVNECNALLDVGDKIKCIVDASRNITNAVAVFRENLSHFLTVVDERVTKVVADTKDCINSEVVSAQQAVSEIIVAAEKCLEEREPKIDLKAHVVEQMAAQRLEQAS